MHCNERGGVDGNATVFWAARETKPITGGRERVSESPAQFVVSAATQYLCYAPPMRVLKGRSFYLHSSSKFYFDQICAELILVFVQSMAADIIEPCATESRSARGSHSTAWIYTLSVLFMEHFSYFCLRFLLTLRSSLSCPQRGWSANNTYTNTYSERKRERERPLAAEQQKANSIISDRRCAPHAQKWITSEEARGVRADFIMAVNDFVSNVKRFYYIPAPLDVRVASDCFSRKLLCSMRR